MSLATVLSRAHVGMRAPQWSRSKYTWPMDYPHLPWWVWRKPRSREARDRVRSAIATSRFPLSHSAHYRQSSPCRSYPKSGAHFDLPIALGILAASGQIPHGLHCQLSSFLANWRSTDHCAACAAYCPPRLPAYPGTTPTDLSAEITDRKQHLCESISESFPATSLLQVCAHLTGETSTVHPSIAITLLPIQSENQSW